MRSELRLAVGVLCHLQGQVTGTRSRTSACVAASPIYATLCHFLLPMFDGDAASWLQSTSASAPAKTPLTWSLYACAQLASLSP